MNELIVTDADVPTIHSMLKTFQETAQRCYDGRQHTENLNEPKICPRIFGERHASNSHGAVSNITTNTDMSLGCFVGSLYRSVVENLLIMMPKQVLDSCGISQIVVTGGSVVENKLLQDMISEIFGLPVRISEAYDAASGAVLF